MHALPYWRLSGFDFFYFAFVGAMAPFWGLYLKSLDRALHLTGVGAPPPWSALGRHLQAVRMPSLRWGFGGHCPGPLGDDHILVPYRCMGYGKFQDAVEQHPSAARAPTVEPEHEFVEVAWQVGNIHGSLVGAQYPVLGQRGDPVHGRQQFARILSPSLSGPLAPAVVNIPFAFNA